MGPRFLRMVSAGGALAAAAMLGGTGAALADGSGPPQPFSTYVTTGTESSHSAQGCQNGHTCIVETQGTATVTAGPLVFLANYDQVLFIDYSKAVVSMGGTYYCAPASGGVVIQSQSKPGNRIYKYETGQVCGQTAAGASHTFTGTFVIVGGTGTFAHATGSGTATASDNGMGSVNPGPSENGTIAYGHGGGGGDD